MEKKDLIVTEEMENILSLIDNKENLFITGKAGCGKTTLLQMLTDKYKFETIVVAPTGVAALNAGGVTIHNMFSLPIGVINPEEKFQWKLPMMKKNVLKYAKILIIDEISMVRCDLMDAIDKRLREARRNQKPFGGIQFLLFGDMMQLPPVVTSEEGNVLSELYDNFYFFNARVFQKANFKMVELTKIFRQKDNEFVSLLNQVREGKLSDDTKRNFYDMLNREITDEHAVHLCALRNVADTFNAQKLGYPEYIFKANIKGDFNPKNANCDLELNLKVGARVMITKNDEEGNYCNGTLGVVEEIKNGGIIVKTDDDNRVLITPNKWESYKYDIDMQFTEDGAKTIIKKECVGTCEQYPLTLAYAITIHKSQGLTFDKVILHIREIFQTGQLYTALSRCRSMENVSIDYNINEGMLTKNNAVDNFIQLIKNNNNEFGKPSKKTKNNG